MKDLLSLIRCADLLFQLYHCSWILAEGAGRKTKNDFIQFLSIARGSKYELETQILICVRLNYFNEEQSGLALQLCSEIGKMLNSLIKKLMVS